jgi:hypothetical protein
MERGFGAVIRDHTYSAERERYREGFGKTNRIRKGIESRRNTHGEEN